MYSKRSMSDLCICKQYERYPCGTGGHFFETQRSSYTCGPIAIINSLHFMKKPAGPAVHRQIMVGCRPKPKHADGFKGTKPADMDRVIRHFWPDAIRSEGAEACLHALKTTASILLFQRSPRLQHYIFVHYDEGTYYLENEADFGTVLETDMGAYMRKTPIVWTIKK